MLEKVVSICMKFFILIKVRGNIDDATVGLMYRRRGIIVSM